VDPLGDHAAAASRACSRVHWSTLPQSKYENAWPTELACTVWQVSEPVPQHAVPAQQLVPQASGVLVLVQVQVEETHDCDPPQACPQLPQLYLSPASAAHVPVQQVSSALQATALAQVEPQWASSAARSKHPASPQLVRPPELQEQFPPAQVVFPGALQATPQVPQFWGSSDRFAQTSGGPAQLAA
jgi:hypothetical protein